MRFADVVLVPVAQGHYGPFSDGRTVPYIDANTAEGDGDPVRITLGEGVPVPDMFRPVRADLLITKSASGHTRFKATRILSEPPLSVTEAAA